VILTQATLRQYTGERDDAGLCHGHGKAVFSSGQVYDGAWQHGHMHGQGSVTFPDNQAYDGCIETDSITGSGVGAQGGGISSQHTAWMPAVATKSALVLSQHSSNSLCTCRQLHDDCYYAWANCRCTHGMLQRTKEASKMGSGMELAGSQSQTARPCMRGSGSMASAMGKACCITTQQGQSTMTVCMCPQGLQQREPSITSRLQNCMLLCLYWDTSLTLWVSVASYELLASRWLLAAAIVMPCRGLVC